MDKYKFGEFIYNQRKKIGLTQDELGRKLNVTNKAVSKWETGETLPDIQLLEKLASTLQVTIDELLTQVKPEQEKVIEKPKIYLHIIQGVISLILLLAVIFLSINSKPNNNITIINKNNASNYFVITPFEKCDMEGTRLTIYGSIEQKEKIFNPYLELSFSIQFYYFNNNDELSEIIYTSRYVKYDGIEPIFSITVEPKNSIDNYKSFYGFNVDYKIVDAKGSVGALL